MLPSSRGVEAITDLSVFSSCRCFPCARPNWSVPQLLFYVYVLHVPEPNTAARIVDSDAYSFPVASTKPSIYKRYSTTVILFHRFNDNPFRPSNVTSTCNKIDASLVRTTTKITLTDTLKQAELESTQA